MAMNFDTDLDQLDPLARLDRRMARLTGTSQAAEREHPTWQDLDADTEQGALERLAGYGLSGIGTVGRILDVFGAPIRGILSGRGPTMTWDPDRPTGQDMLDSWGWTAPAEDASFGEKALHWTAGLASELATDPLAMFGGTAWTAGGKLAKAAGLTRNLQRVASKNVGKAGVEAIMGAKKAAQYNYQLGPRASAAKTTLKELIEGSGPEAMAKVQRAAEKKGVNVAALLDEPTGGGLGVGPFGIDLVHIPVPVSVSNFLDKPGRWLRYGAPGRAAAQLFGPGIGDVSTTAGQQMVRDIAARTDDLTAAARGEVGGWWERLGKENFVDDVGEREFSLAMDTGDLSKLPPEVRRIAEEIRANRATELSPMQKLGIQTQEYAPPQLPDMVMAEQFPRFASDLADPGSDILAKAKGVARVPGEAHRTDVFGDIPKATVRAIFAHPEVKAALATKNEKDLFAAIKRNFIDTKRVPSQMIDSDLLKQASPDIAETIANALVRTQGSFGFGNAPVLGRVPAKVVADMLQDPDVLARIAANDASGLSGVITTKYLQTGILPSGNAVVDRIGPLTEAVAKVPLSQADVGLFDNANMADLITDKVGKAGKVGRAEGILDALAKPGAITPATGAKGEVSLKALIEAVNLNPGSEQAAGALDELATRLWGGGAPPLDELAKMAVEPGLAKDIVKLVTRTTPAREYGPVLSGIHSLTNLFKGGVTTLFPNFHVRNRFSGLANSLLQGTWRPIDDAAAKALMRGKVVQGLDKIPIIRDIAAKEGRTLTDEVASDIARRLVWQHEVAPGIAGEVASRVGKAARETQPRTNADIADQFAGGINDMGKPFSWQTVIDPALLRESDTTLNPLASRGVFGNEVTRFGLGVAGERAGGYVEGVNRISPFLNQLRKGVDPGEAARNVAQAQVSYRAKDFSTFENEILKVLFPFYSFTSRQAKHVAKELNPLTGRTGGRMGQFVRAVNSLRDEKEILPDYVSQGLSIGIPPGSGLEAIFGSPGEGSKRVLGGLGLMPEDPLQFATALTNPRDTLMELVSRSNPLIKGPLEWATGRSFFQRSPEGGRALEDMDPVLGRLASNISDIATGVKPGDGTRTEPVKLPQWLETLASNSPLSRALTTARTATDQRKWNPGGLMNLLTGARFTDVSPGAQDALVRETVARALMDSGAGKTFERTYVPEEILAKLPPEERQQVLILSSLMRKMGERVKARKEGKTVPSLGRME